jgi:hypothetical protein
VKNTLAVIHAPGATEGQVQMLVRKLRYYLKRYNLPSVTIKINPKMPLQEDDSERSWNTLVLGWGLPFELGWDKWVYEYNLARVAQEFLAFDLFERRRYGGQILYEPRVNAGRYWSRKIQERNLQLFLDGYYVKSVAPYGTKCVLKKRSRENPPSLRSYYILEPGDQEEVEIVRLIFDLFVNHDYSRSKICNLLSAQLVKPPGKSTRWRGRVVKAILENPVYIGANEYRRNIRFNVFPLLGNKSIFFAAQAKIMREPVTRKDVNRMNREYALPFKLRGEEYD